MVADGAEIEVPERLTGPRVLLRPYVADDIPAFWESLDESRAHMNPWEPWVNQYREPEALRPRITRAQALWAQRRELSMGIFDRGTGHHLGGIGLYNIDWTLRTLEIGYWVRKSAEGHGYVSESVRLVTRLAFDQFGANRVQIQTDPRNVRSVSVARRQGYTLEAVLRRAGPIHEGESIPSDTCVFALIREEYDALDW